MTAYVPTAWVNNVAPALSAANLNKLTDELELQASDVGITHSLPTWADGVAPALTDAAPLNEMERVTRDVALAVELSYTPTVWETGWTPARNAARFNQLEAQAVANRNAIDSITEPSTLPFAEADLRPGYITLTTADITLDKNSFTLPTTSDYLIDLGWVKRDRMLKIYTRPGQRVHTRNVYIDVTIAPVVGSTAYGRSGFGYRPVSASAAPADHLSLTGCLITGTTLADGLTFGDSLSTSNNALTVTYQMCRVESRSSRLGRQIVLADEPSGEHYDAFQMQGPCSRMEFGICTMVACNSSGGLQGGKGFMLNAYNAVGNGGIVEMNQVNIRDDGPTASFTGNFINQDYATIQINLTDVYALKEGSGAYVWATNSNLFLMGSRDAAAQAWTSSGTAPNRTATFAPGYGWSGVIREGRSPDGQDFCTRADLGLT